MNDNNHKENAKFIGAVIDNDNAQSEGKLNPWFSILYKPRKTIQQIIDNDPRKYILLLAAIHGTVNIAARQFPVSLLNDASPDLSALYKYSLIVFLSGPIGGIIVLYLFSFLIRISGILLKGQGTPQTIRAAIAWSSVPYIWAGLLYPITFFIWRKFHLPIVHSIIIYTILPYGIIICSKSIAQVQKFKSAWLGFLNIVSIPIILLILIKVLSMAALLVEDFTF